MSGFAAARTSPGIGSLGFHHLAERPAGCHKTATSEAPISGFDQ
jgi:hypothetical protein